MSEEDILSSVRRSLREEQLFFSNRGKSEREMWVAREFLRSLPIAFDENELKAPPQDDDADVLFREARFQIKEITEPDLYRSPDIRARLKRAESANSLQDLVEAAEAHDIVLSNAYLLILERASTTQYPPKVKANLDLLCYITRAYAGFGTEEERNRLAEAGWRSISCLFGRRSLVLCATSQAPSFLGCP